MKLAARLALSLAVAAGLLVLLMLWGDVGPLEALATLGRLPPSAYVVALGMHAGVYLVRTWRYQILVPREIRPRYVRALVVSAAHNLATYVLPAKTGEASFVVYLRAHGGVPATAGLASLLVSRLLDGAVLCGLLALACVALALSDDHQDLVWLEPLGGVLAAGSVALLVLSWRVDLIVRFLGWCVGVLRITRWEVGRRLVVRIGRVAEALRVAGGGGKLLLAAALSVPVWGGIFAFYAVLARPMGLPEFVGLAEATFGSSLAMLSNLLPVNGVAGFGTQEVGWTVGFEQLGVPRDVALSTGVGVHLVQLFNVCAMGFLAHVAMGLLPRLEQAPIADTAATEEATGGLPR